MITKFLAVLALGGLAIFSSHGMTLEEFKAKSPEEKVTLFRAKPDEVIQPLSDLVGLGVLGLNDPSKAVQKAAAQWSIFLVQGLQTADKDVIPTFSERDTEAFQHALCSHLTSPDDETRASAALALIYAYPPESHREAFFFRQIKREPNAEVQGGLLEAMVQMGYHSRAVVEQALAFMRPDVGRAIHPASQVLAYLKPPQALEPLIALASKPSESQRAALEVLAAYGEKADAAKPALNALLKSDNLNREIQHAAGRALEAIVSGKPIPGRLRSLPSVRHLWPEALTDPR